MKEELIAFMQTIIENHKLLLEQDWLKDSDHIKRWKREIELLNYGIIILKDKI